MFRFHRHFFSKEVQRPRNIIDAGWQVVDFFAFVDGFGNLDFQFLYALFDCIIPLLLSFCGVRIDLLVYVVSLIFALQTLCICFSTQLISHFLGLGRSFFVILIRSVLRVWSLKGRVVFVHSHAKEVDLIGPEGFLPFQKDWVLYLNHKFVIVG